MRYWAECGSLIREFRRQGRITGALLPSSRFLARALVSELRKSRPSASILEVGPGTGSVTQEIVRYLTPNDRLDLVEINPRFVSLLEARYQREWVKLCAADRFRVISSAVEKLPGDRQYDYIVSCLPLNNFPVAQVREIFRAFARLLKPGGTLTYFEYVFVRQLKTPFVNRHERWRLGGVGRVVGGYIRSYQVKRQPILINVPPAIVRHLCLNPTAGHSPDAARRPARKARRPKETTCER
jgi:phospholipid N-methyltransferase